jgi:hypothetical protein
VGYTESSLLPFRLEEAEVAIYPQSATDCVPAGLAIFTGCCQVTVGLDADYVQKERLATAGQMRRVRSGRPQYRIELERVALQNEVTAGASDPVVMQLSDQLLAVARGYMVVVVWQDVESGRWLKRTYAYAERAATGFSHPSGNLHSAVSLVAALQSEDAGDRADYDLAPRLLGEVWHVSATGEESLCYTYDLIENTWKRLVPTWRIASRVGIDLLSASPEITVHGNTVISYGSDVLQLQSLAGVMNDGGVAAIDREERAEFRLFGVPVAAITPEGWLYANSFEAVAGLGGDYAGEAFAFAWPDVRIDARGVRAPAFEFTLT